MLAEKPSEKYASSKEQVQAYLKQQKYVPVAFRLPRQGEMYLRERWDGYLWIDEAPQDFHFQKYLILRKAGDAHASQ